MESAGHEQVPVALSYQRGLPGGISATRRHCARMLLILCWGLVAFAGLLGWIVFDRVVIEWLHWSGMVLDPVLGPVWKVRKFRVYNWSRLVWVAAAVASPMVMAGSYWFLARMLRSRRERMYTVLALSLAILHTLAMTALALTFFVAGMANFRWGLMTLVASAASMLGLAMVPATLYVSVRLMDLLGERPVSMEPTAVADDRAVPDAAARLAALAEDEDGEE